MASRGVLRDVGRVLDMPYNFCDQLSELIPVVQNKPVGLREAREILKEVRKHNEIYRIVIHAIAIGEFQKEFLQQLAVENGGVFIDMGR